MTSGSIKLKILFPTGLIIAAVMAGMVAVVLGITLTVSAQYQRLRLGLHATQIQRIINEAVSEVVSAQLMGGGDLSDSMRRKALEQLQAYWNLNDLEGCVKLGGTELLCTIDPEHRQEVSEAAARGYFRKFHGLASIDGCVIEIPSWNWRIVTATRPTSLVRQTGVTMLIPLTAVGGLVLLGGVLLVLHRNLARPMDAVVGSIARGQRLHPTGITEIDDVGRAVNKAVDALKSSNDRLRMLHGVELSLQQVSALDEFFSNLLEKAGEILNTGVTALALTAPGTDEVVRVVRTRAMERAGVQPYCKGLYREILSRGGTLVLRELTDDPSIGSLVTSCCPTLFRNLLAVPVRSGKGYGSIVLVLGNREEGFGTDDYYMAEAIAAQAMTGMERILDTGSLAHSELHYRTLAEGVGDHIFEIDGQQKIAYVNRAAARRYGRQPGDFIGQPREVLFPGASSGALIDRLEESFATGHAQSIEHAITTLGGAETWMITRLYPLLDEQGKVYRVIGIGTDISDRIRAEEALRRAYDSLEEQNIKLRELDTMKDGLIRDVSHELKTPVAKQAMQLELLREALGGECPAEIMEIVGVMEGTVKRQELMVRNLLDLSRIESGGRRYAIVPVRLDEFVTETLREYERAFRLAGIEARATCEAVTTLADREMLWHVVSNVLNNALKFRRREGPGNLRAMTGIDHGAAFASFTDDGIGIDPAVLPRVFERFYQGSASSEGAGVGLSICKQLVEDMGGSIRLSSDGPGTGVTVTITLPLAGTT